MHQNRQRLIWFALLLSGFVLAGAIRPDANRTRAQAVMEPRAHLPLVVRAAATPTPQPTVTPQPTATPGPGVEWLSYLNYLRALGNLPPVAENASWSDGAQKHSRYSVKTDTISHDEDPGSPYFTPEGNLAAQNGNVMVHSSVNTSDQDALDLWMTGAFHGIGMIDPALRQAGYGSYREADGGWQMAATLDVLRGLGSIPGSVQFPIKWPDNGKALPFTSYDGSEYPDPLTSCPGYSAPSGPPIYLQIGPGNVTPNVTASSFMSGGTDLEYCLFTETTYNGEEQSLARNILGSRDAIVLLPRAPLSPGTTYDVLITANGTTHSWSFSAAADASSTRQGIQSAEPVAP